MATVVTVVSRFCYRSPTRPLFVAGLIFLILITWKFLVAQPDANALMMHSKAEKTWSERKRIQPEQPHLHVPLQSPVKSDESRKRLVNKLPEVEDLGGADKQEKKDDSSSKSDKVIQGETQDGGREQPAPVSKQSFISITKDSNYNKIDKTKNEDVVLEKGVTIEGTQLKIHKGTSADESVQMDKKRDENVEKQTISSQQKNQSKTQNANKKIKLEENDINERTPSKKNKERHGVKSSITTAINHAGVDASNDRDLPSNGNVIPVLTTATLITQNKNENIATQDNLPIGKYNILLTLVKMSPNSQLAKSMKKFLKSVCRHTSVTFTLHAVVDDIGKTIVKEYFQTSTGLCKETQVIIHNVNEVVGQLKPLTHFLQEYFSRENSYYNDPIFFMSTAIHKVLSEKLKQVIMLDVDLRFMSDIKELFDMFNNFKGSNIMGIAREQSPVYRHILWKHRGAHKGTLVGDPPPNGITGFNSGVVLFNLENMRKSSLYNHILQGEEIKRLTEKYSFRGHLGDQDFFTLLSFEYPGMFYTIPCSWNRQLCTYWKDNGYADVWDQYFNCTGPIHVYHGNCRTPIPVDNDR